MSAHPKSLLHVPLVLLLTTPALLGISTCASVDEDGDGYSSDEDCNDLDPLTYPGAPEVCDGVDNDCNGQVDEGYNTQWYPDADGDGYGAGAQPEVSCSPLEGKAADNTDCDDSNAWVHPGAPEVCDGVDNDCDGIHTTDASGWPIYYPDADGDGFGDASATPSCVASAGAVTNNSDCRDSDASTYPGASDNAGDGKDSSCDGVDGLAPSVGMKTSQFTSIQAALDASGAGQTVWVGPGTYLEFNLRMKGKPVRLSSSHGPQVTHVDAQSRGSVFLFTSAETSASAVHGLTLTHGMATDGGGIYSSGASPTLAHVILKGNEATGFGGAFMFKSGAPVLQDCDVAENSAANGGGGALAGWTAPRLTGVTFRENSASWSGGGLFIAAARAALEQVDALGNSAVHGGGLMMEGGELTLAGGLWTDNQADETQGKGGGMMLVNVSPQLSGVQLSNNRAGNGAGAYLDTADPSIEQVSLTGNVAEERGGGLYLQNSSPSLHWLTVKNNSSGYEGGGMYLNSSHPDLQLSTFEGNSAYVGGGISFYLSSPTLEHVTVNGNYASFSGGGSICTALSP